MANAFWHGFADMHAISNNGPLVITKGEGSWIWDEKERSTSTPLVRFGT